MVLDHNEPYKLHRAAMLGDLDDPRSNDNSPSIQLSPGDFNATLFANSFSIACIRLKRTHGFGGVLDRYNHSPGKNCAVLTS